MRILIVSDTHRKTDLLEEIFIDEGPFDMLIHCGDIEGDEDRIYYMTGAECACVMVPGNNDYLSMLPRERAMNIAGKNVWITHGHRYYVSMDTAIIRDEAASRGIHIVMFGHTHKPLVDYSNGIYLINPGSLTYPRQNGRRPSYIIMNIEEGGEPKFEICYR